jgi:predicted aspartyl protease
MEEAAAMKVSNTSRRDMAGLALMALFPGQALARDSVAVQPASSPLPSEDLNYLDRSRRLTVQVMINGQGPFAFMVDTGANSSVISSETADQLGLVRRQKVALHGIAGVQVVDTGRIDRLRVGRRVNRDMVLSVLSQTHLGTSGLLGLEWLGANSLMLDYGGRQMRIGAALPLPNERTVVVKARMQRSGLTLIDAHIPGRSVMAFLDSGSTTTVGNLALLQAARDRNAVVGPLIDIQLRSVTGQTLPGRIAVLRSLTLGKMILRHVPLVIGPVHTFDYWGMRDEPALLIGSDVLQKFDSIAMDFKRGEIRFQISDRG